MCRGICGIFIRLCCVWDLSLGSALVDGGLTASSLLVRPLRLWLDVLCLLFFSPAGLRVWLTVSALPDWLVLKALFLGIGLGFGRSRRWICD